MTAQPSGAACDKACQFDDDASGKAQLCDTTTVLTQPRLSFREAAARAEI